MQVMPIQTLEGLLKKGTDFLLKHEVDQARREARLLLAHVLKVKVEALYLYENDCAVGSVQKEFDALLVRRSHKEPLSKIIGKREFLSLDFKITKDTLDPRPDSETLIEIALRYWPHDTPLKILDIGTGSGCLLLAALSEFKLAYGIGTDCSREALEVAQENAIYHHLADRVLFIHTRWARGIKEGAFDLVLSNPPYISTEEFLHLPKEVKHYDPYQALVGGDDGLDAYRSLKDILYRLLAPKGIAIIEHGHTQGASVKEILASSPWREVKSYKDLGDRERCLLLRK